MQRRALSPLGLKRQKLGRKVIASARVAAGIERKLGVAASSPVSPQSTTKKRRLPEVHYTFQRWHAFVAVGCIVLLIGGNFAYGQIKAAQAAEAKRQADAKQKVEAAAAEKRQACYKSTVATKAQEVGKLTYDQLYGDTCK